MNPFKDQCSAVGIVYHQIVNLICFALLCRINKMVIYPAMTAEFLPVGIEDDPVITGLRHREFIVRNGVAYMEIEDEDQLLTLENDGLILPVHVDLVTKTLIK